MPTYDYQCQGCGLKVEISCPMLVQPPQFCTDCGTEMYKIFPVPAVNWGGLKPSDLENNRSPAVQSMIDNESENRDKYIEKKEKRNDRH